MCKEEFIQSINENTQFTYSFCKMLCGYSMYDPDFLDAVMDKFIGYGRERVKYIYSLYLELELQKDNEELKPIAYDLAEKIEREYGKKVKENENNRKKTEVRNWHGFKGFPSIQ